MVVGTFVGCKPLSQLLESYSQIFSTTVEIEVTTDPKLQLAEGSLTHRSILIAQGACLFCAI